MTIVKRYTLTCPAANEVPLRAALDRLACSARVIDGCERVEIERHETRCEMLFAERWRDEQAMRASAGAIDKAALQDVLRLADDIGSDIYTVLC